MSRSTLDHLVRFQTSIREVFVNRQFCVPVLFDLEKAYDKTWQHNLLQDLVNLGIKNRIIADSVNYLGRRPFLLNLGTVIYRKIIQEIGAHERDALGVILFTIKINSISRATPSISQHSLVAYGLHILFSSCNFETTNDHCKYKSSVYRNGLIKTTFKFILR